MGECCVEMQFYDAWETLATLLNSLSIPGLCRVAKNADCCKYLFQFLDDKRSAISFDIINEPHASSNCYHFCSDLDGK